MINNIINVLNSINIPESNYILKKMYGAYWGKDSGGNTVFGLDSNENINTIIETTKYLTLLLNVHCDVEENDIHTCKKLNILILKNSDQIHLFINLALAFIENQNVHSFLNFFLYLKELFAIEGRVAVNELQGLYGELFTLYYFKSYIKRDISIYYQSANNMKFDFSIKERKKIEVKTSLKEKRIHHFINEQLNTLRYDIKIVSILLQKDDKGLSLEELINRCKELFSDNLNILLKIERLIKNWEPIDLQTISFNEKYTLDNIKVFDANDVPRILEKNNEGIYKIEYDSDLSNSNYLSSDDLCDWLSDK